MMAVRASLSARHLPDSLLPIRLEIEAAIPAGTATHKEVTKRADKVWYGNRQAEWIEIDKKHPNTANKKSAIPGSMGARSFIFRGKGNNDSFESCSHGAGRKFSRSEAKRRITLKQHAEAMKGIEARLDGGLLDESPAAYKTSTRSWRRRLISWRSFTRCARSPA
jgi:hypothetical protein